MRPYELAPLFAPVETLKGVGPRVAKLLKTLLKPRRQPESVIVLDLLLHLPAGLIDRGEIVPISEGRIGEVATLKIRVAEHRPGGGRRYGRAPYRILAEDETGALELVYFNADKRYLDRMLPVGAERLVSGKLEAYDGLLQMPHPDYIATPEDGLPALEPVYPLTAGLGNAYVRKLMAEALPRVPQLPEWIDAAWKERQAWPSFPEAIRIAHAPEAESDLLPTAKPRERLAYDELLANQLALAAIRSRMRRAKGRCIKGDGALRDKILAALPFELTKSQRFALAEIDGDMAAETRMLRLLQGDVGSGKTVVALLAMATAIEAGGQAALMAPTEILARQHAKTIGDLAETVGLKLAILTGRERGAARQAVLDALAAGEIDILVGTHALFQEGVEFKDLALAVIDEQHRFGVHQRLSLQGKGNAAGAELLVMTATPIPRTLLLTTFGDMDVSRLTEKPPGRRPIATRIVPDERLEEVIAAVSRALSDGAQIYWVCPLVAESETLDLAAAEDRYADLKDRFGDKVGLIHGKLKAAEKDAVMAAFAGGELSILVSTTVIEVGVDVPNASIMIIEHAERFGLSQLHQLRGRVGRGAKESACILLYRAPLTETARQRLAVMRDTEDGFVIAEEDLRLRGGGEVLGTRQSGLPAFRVARLPEHQELLAAASDEARLALTRDPTLKEPRSAPLRTLLYLFERDDAIRLLRAG
ncbi:ATP-dependent DNA helicase RecG [Methyloligella sp. 2.7D]|uniref:ATP-dependent DNA helicase RecG n=1 Tax=unclassified Methyloligella TaxID=2625955 RepID=UPI00157D5A65|nr:ATP-dependent DNA helicase RecG [Methyloligella sp. GL2]QKP77665.1 ATP-dependent DNA helicase RecG [Methyloligella sp. GL2]